MARKLNISSKSTNTRNLASMGPGKAAKKVTPRPAGGNFGGGMNTFKPKGLSTYKNSRVISGK